MIKKQTTKKIIIPLLFILALILCISAVSAADTNTSDDSLNSPSNGMVLIEISGQVDQCSDGTPFQGATVTVLDNGTQVASTTTGADGTYSTSFQSVNRVFTVTASANGHKPSTQTVTVKNNQETYTGSADFQLGNDDAYVYQGWVMNPDEDYTFSDTTTINGNAPNAFTTIEDGINYATGQSGVNTVYIAPGTYNEYSMSIDTSVNLHGEDQATTIIDADDNAKILTIWNDATVNIDQLTFRDGASEYGGALRVESGTVTINNCTFDSNTVPDNGGAIYVDSGATVTISCSTFTDNTAIYNINGNTNGAGGAINNVGTLTLEDSSFTSNSAGYDGGAINNYGTLTLEDCSFTSNSADSFGGAIGDIGTGTYSGCTFTSNSAGDGGGAIALGSYGGVLETTVKGCTFISNTAFDIHGSDLGGGAIYDFSHILNANYNRFYNNIADNGSAIYYLDDGSVDAENNWWGLNNPISEFPSLIYGTSAPRQWLYMTISANPTTIHNSENSQITVSFNNYSSDGTTYTEFTPTDLDHIPDGTPVTFSLTNGPFGTLTPPLTVNTLGGLASIPFTATSVGVQEVNATLDDQIVPATVTILAAAHADLDIFFADYNEFVNNNYNIVPITDPVNYLDRVVVVSMITNLGPNSISFLQYLDSWSTYLAGTNDLWSSWDAISWGHLSFTPDGPHYENVLALNPGHTQYVVIGATVIASNTTITNNITTVSQTPDDIQGFDTASANLVVNPATYVNIYKEFRDLPWGNDITTAIYNDRVYAMVQIQNDGPDSTSLTVLDTLTGITWTGVYYVLSGSNNPSDPDNWVLNDAVNTFDGTQWNIPTFSSFIGGNVKWLAIEGIINQVGTVSNYAETISQSSYAYNGYDNDTASITTSAAPTNLTVDDVSGDKDDTVTLSAVLTDQQDNPLNSMTIEFWIDNVKVGENTTDSTGTASFDYKITQTPGSHQLKAIFNGNTQYQASEATGDLYVPSADLYIVITSNKNNTTVGETFTLTYKLGNNGPDKATNVTITIPIPEGFHISRISGDGTWKIVGNNIIWTFDQVKVGDPYLYITGWTTAPGEYLFTASINSNTFNINSRGVNSLSISSIETPETNAATTNTIGMRNTGAPLAGIVLAILMVLGGLIGTRKKQ